MSAMAESAIIILFIFDPPRQTSTLINEFETAPFHKRLFINLPVVQMHLLSRQAGPSARSRSMIMKGQMSGCERRGTRRRRYNGRCRMMCSRTCGDFKPPRNCSCKRESLPHP